MKRQTPERLAAAAGLPVSSLAQLEATGQCAEAVNWQALADCLGLDGARLEAVARGWRPQGVDMSFWRELRQITTTQVENTVHCYLVWDEVTREAALFDTGWDAVPVLELVAREQLQLKHVFLTHTHDDHMAALGAIREQFPKIRLHTSSKHAPPQHRNRPNDFIHLGSLRLTHRDTPGHAEDGVTYVIGMFPEDAPHAAIVGDALFAGSMGSAPDHPELARQKIREQIFTLPPQTLICPGHGQIGRAHV